MSRPAIQSPHWNFHVSQRRLLNPIPNGPALDFFGNFRDDTGECLGVTSEQYGIVQNPELMDAARAALEARGLSGYSERVLVTGNGVRFYAEFTFANKQIASAVGDLFGYKLVLKNSFDRTLRAAFSLGFLRLACLNGAATLEKEFSVTRKHSASVSVGFVGDAIDKAMQHSQSALGVYDQMAGVEITDEQGVNVLGQLVLADALSASMRDEIVPGWLNPKRDEDKARNLWTLYNAATEHLTHQVAENRYEYAAKVSNGLLMRLANAARRADALAKLIAPVPTDAQVVVIDV